MALGSVAVSGGMSKKEKERMMYMDGKLVWSAAMGASSSMSTTAPAEVDYIVVKPMALAFTSSIAYSQQKNGTGCPRRLRSCIVDATFKVQQFGTVQLLCKGHIFSRGKHQHLLSAG